MIIVSFMGLGSLTGPGSRVPADGWRYCYGDFDLRDYRACAATGPVQSRGRLALVGLLTGYSGLTRDAYELDLRQYVTWCTERDIVLFGARRSDIESFGCHLESIGRARATISRR